MEDWIESVVGRLNSSKCQGERSAQSPVMYPNRVCAARQPAIKLEIHSPVVICGDTLEHRKPHPLPLQVAARRLGLECGQCIYVGDDERDVISGNAASMKTVIAAYGYIEPNTDIHSWKADEIIQQPVDLIDHPLFF